MGGFVRLRIFFPETVIAVPSHGPPTQILVPCTTQLTVTAVNLTVKRVYHLAQRKSKREACVWCVIIYVTPLYKAKVAHNYCELVTHQELYSVNKYHQLIRKSSRKGAWLRRNRWGQSSIIWVFVRSDVSEKDGWRWRRRDKKNKEEVDDDFSSKFSQNFSGSTADDSLH